MSIKDLADAKRLCVARYEMVNYPLYGGYQRKELSISKRNRILSRVIFHLEIAMLRAQDFRQRAHDPNCRKCLRGVWHTETEHDRSLRPEDWRTV